MSAPVATPPYFAPYVPPPPCVWQHNCGPIDPHRLLIVVIVAAVIVAVLLYFILRKSK